MASDPTSPYGPIMSPPKTLGVPKMSDRMPGGFKMPKMPKLNRRPNAPPQQAGKPYGKGRTFSR